MRLHPVRKRNFPGYFLWVAALSLLTQDLFAQPIPAAERDALIALYNTNNGDGWSRKNNWLGPVGTESAWQGVTVAGGHVVTLNLRANGVRGVIAPQIGNLTFLEKLDLGNSLTDFFGNANRVTGVPNEIGGLTNLMILNLSNNPIEFIPSQIGQMTRLRELYLSGNQLAALPPEIGGLTELERLDVDDNRLTELPEQIVQLSRLKTLRAYSNALRELPPQIDGWAALETLNLSYNQLEILPQNWRGLSNLKEIDLRDNLLASLPQDLSELSGLETLIASNNRLSVLPAGMEKLSRLKILHLSGNELVELPAETGQLAALEELNVAGNRLASFPPGLGGLASLRELRARQNELAQLPPQIGGLGNLQVLDLLSNQLQELPSEVGNLKALRTLILSLNQLDALPSELQNLQNLTALFSDDNRLKVLPDWLHKLTKLEWLNLNGNRMTGSVPPELVQLPGLQFRDGISPLNLLWNALETNDAAVREYFGRVAFGPPFETTQTTAPGGLGIEAVTGSSLRLTWTPIPFSSHSGGYEVFFRRKPDGPWQLAGRTLGKDATGFSLEGLDVSTHYGMAVRTVTEPHQDNGNVVRSRLSEEVAFTTLPQAEFYFPFLRSDSTNFSGLAISNEEDRSLSFKLEAFDQDGKLQTLGENPAAFELTPGGQTARLASEIFGVAPNSTLSAWVRLTADSSRLTGLFQTGGEGRLDGAGALGSQSDRLNFPRVLEGDAAFLGHAARTFLSVANPNLHSIALTLRLHRPSDNDPVETQRDIPARGFMLETIEGLFAGPAPLGSFATVEVTQGAGALGFAWIEFDGGRSVAGLNAVPSTGGSKLHAAQVAAGPAIFTHLQLVNISGQPRAVTLKMADSHGMPLASAQEMTIPARRAFQGNVSDIFGVEAAQGTLTVESDAPGVRGDVLFGDPESLRFAAVAPLQPEAFLEAALGHVANALGAFTGVALWNVGAAPADVLVEVFSRSGGKTGQALIRVRAGERVVKLLDQLVPSSAGQAGGRVKISSSQPLIAQELFGSLNLDFLTSVAPRVLESAPSGPPQPD